ncbi:MAG TPA: TolC family protein [Firmicutes bacterium]|nr:TolC family protein [Bacillota bacterium]
MKPRLFFGLAAVMIFFVCASPLTFGSNITLREAVELAYAQNAQYQLSLWEHQLTAKEQQLADKTPTVKFASTPLKLNNGDLSPAEGTVTLTVPLGDRAAVTGIVDVYAEKFDFDVNSRVGLSLDYDFFAPDPIELLTDRDSLTVLANNLILETVETVLSLDRELNQLALEEMRLDYLQEAYQAAVVRDQTLQAQQLKQQLYECETKISNLRMSVKQQNQKLNNLLATTDIDYLPVIKLKAYELQYNQQLLLDLALTHSDQRSQAIAALLNAENELKAAESSGGWKINGSANLWWDVDFKKAPSWSVAVTANKELYPPSLQLEKSRLNLAKAQLRLAEVEQSIANQVAQLVQKLELLEAQRVELEQDLLAAEEELATTRRHYEAGLAAQLQLKEQQLEISRLTINLVHNQYDQFIAIMQLMNQCGFSLDPLLSEIETEEG